MSDTLPLTLSGTLGRGPQPSRSGRQRAWLVLITALAYAVAGHLALHLAVQPGNAAPLFPAAGIALAMVLRHGGVALLGVWLGALAVNAETAGPLGPGPWLFNASVAAALACGSTLQAWLGAALLRRVMPGPITLGEPRDVALFCGLGAAAACLCSASLAHALLIAVGVMPASALGFSWWTWWAGDTLGVLIGTPVVLSLIGLPREDWHHRRVTLALPLLATTGLLALATLRVADWDRQRVHSVFERDAAATALALGSQLEQAALALEATRGLMIGSDDVSPAELQRAAASWLVLPIRLQAVGMAMRVPRSQLAPFEAEVARSLGQPYKVFDRPAAPGSVPIAAADPDVMAIRMIEPRAGNTAALGANVLSIPAARDAVQQATDTDAAAASAGFRLTQEQGDQTGVVLYRALYRDGTPSGVAERRAALRGLVFVTLRMQTSFDAGLRQAPMYLRGCLFDADPQAPRQHLAGAPGCVQASPRALLHTSTVRFGGRLWVLRLDAHPNEVPDAGHGNAWLFSTVGLLATAMLSALLLTVTGRTRRIEAAVDARTTELLREVGERQRTEAALRESEQRFRNIFDHAPVGIVYADLRGRMHDANPRLRELLGYGPEALARHSLADLTHPDERERDAHDLALLLAGETAEVQRTTRLVNRQGQTLWARMNWTVLRDAQGHPQRLVAVVEDITDELRRQDAERGRQAAEAANAAKNDFLSRMSHELRTPLNAMLGFAQLLDLDSRPRLADHQRTWVGQILQAGWHLLEMINDTLDLARIDSGMVRMSLAPVALQPLLAQCVAMMEPAALRRQVTIELEPGPEGLRVVADATRLKQVLTNLLSNAVKYNVPAGRVQVQTRRIGDHGVQVRVLDTGLGLSETQMANLFQPFNRLGREQGGTEGTGIGLVISRRLAELMGGTLEAERSEVQGATFVLTLHEASHPEGDDASEPAPDPLAARYRRRRVHYIEDNETNVEVMRGILAQRPQILLEVSALGLDGLTAIRRQPPDLILLDMNLPDVDGLELLRQLQRDPDCATVPVVVVSADATPARVEDALAAGARRYMTKPLNLGSFLGMLDELLEGINSRYS